MLYRYRSTFIIEDKNKMGLMIKARNHKKISEPAEFQIEDFLNYQEMMTYLGYSI